MRQKVDKLLKKVFGIQPATVHKAEGSRQPEEQLRRSTASDILQIFPEKNVELLWKGDYVLFSPKSESWKDLIYFDNYSQQWIPNSRIAPEEYLRHQSTIQVKPPTYGDTRGLSWILIQHLMNNYSSPLLYFDVGGYVGNFTIETALLSQYEDFDIEIFTFEPGPIYPVLKKSIEINNLKPKITLVNSAISDVVGPILYSYRIGGVIGGHIGAASADGLEVSEICNSTTIDAFVEHTKGIQTPYSYIIKLDCQGFEYQVYQGCQKLLNSGNPVIFLSEFLSWSYTEDYKKFLADYFVFDVTSHMCLQGVTLIETAALSAFVDTINQTESLTTDLLLVPKSLKNSEQLVANLLAASKT